MGRTKRECANCRFWSGGEAFGECRRNAPVSTRDAFDSTPRLFPITDADEWCGEWGVRAKPEGEE